MLVLSDYRPKGTNNTRWAMFDGTTYSEYEPEELPIILNEFVSRTKAAETVYVTNLNMYFLDIILTLWKMGFNPLKTNPSVSKMRVHDMKYLINGELKCYSITIKTKAKRAIVFVNYDNIVNLGGDRDKIIEAWAADDEGSNLKKYTLAIYRSINMLNKDCEIKERFPLTISAYARRKWKKTSGFWFLKNKLPNANSVKIKENETLEQFCRKAYHGGLNIARNKALTSDLINLPGMVLDANSLYPFVMKNFYMPIGMPKYFEGKPSDSFFRDARNGYIYMFLRVRVSMDLKPDGIPCVCMYPKDEKFFLHKKGWIESTKYYSYSKQEYINEKDPKNPNMITLTLTMTDYWLMLENYDIHKIEYVEYLTFFTSKSLFDDYITEYYEKKKNAKTEGDKRIAKMMLVALSGNMARLPEYTNLIIEIDERGRIHTGQDHSCGGESYVYVGAAITSYGREYLIRHAKRYSSLWLYSDTDSVHLLGDNIPKGFSIGEELGQWKVEKRWDKVTYYKLKMYGIIKDGKVKYTLAGIPRDNITALERLTENPYDYTLHDLDAIDFALENVFEDEDYDPEITMSNNAKRLENMIEDIKELGLKAIHYIEFPVTIRRHDVTEFSEHLSTQWTSLSDKGFLNKS